jgi:glycerol-3-phosphate dehydrogenase
VNVAPASHAPASQAQASHAGTAPDLNDVAVIGGGVVGCAIARGLTLRGYRTILLEKAPDILDGASKANSAILHTGFDAPPGSLEARLVAQGHAEYLQIHDALGLPLLRSGALVIAWTPEEEAVLPDLIAQAHENGVGDVEHLGRDALRALEPELAPGARAAFRVPREYLIDPWSAPLAYLQQAMANGARVLRHAAVTGGAFDGGAFDGGAWRLDTTAGPVAARLVVNAGGLYGDRIDAALIGRTDFTIRPRKGQFVVYDKPAAALADHILLPVPNKVTKGIVVCRTAWGNLLVGPTAEEQEDREKADLVPETLAALRRRGEEILPALQGQEVTAIYAGLRPATEFKDYMIRPHAGLNYLTVGGIRSTGLSAALGIAGHVADLLRDIDPRDAPRPLADPVWPRVPMLAETGARDWTRAGHGGIVCHCESVTRREIEAALSGPLPAGSMAGLKRRTRATMGRCQGFYCGAALARLTEGRFAGDRVEAAHDA